MIDPPRLPSDGGGSGVFVGSGRAVAVGAAGAEVAVGAGADVAVGSSLPPQAISNTPMAKAVIVKDPTIIRRESI